jgi:hypothetical protein
MHKTNTKNTINIPTIGNACINKTTNKNPNQKTHNKNNKNEINA